MKYLFIIASLFLVSFSPPSSVQTYEGLQQQSAAEHKNIIIYFSGSDWCMNCNLFKKKYLQNEAVRATIDKDFVYYNADFPQRKKLEKDIVATNEKLAEQLNKDGVFPVMVIADKDMHILEVIKLGGSAEALLEQLQRHSQNK